MTALLDHLWQSTVFVAVAGTFTLLLRSNSAAARYWVWFTASLKFLFPFAWLVAVGSFLSPYFASSLDIPASLQSVEIVVTPFGTTSSSFSDIALLLSIAWGLGFVTVASLWLSRWVKLGLIVRNAADLPVVAPVPVKSTVALMEPGLVGIWRPVLLLPEGIAERLSAHEMQAILAHELGHWRRKDNLTAAFHMLVEALFWFYPLVWWLGARLIAERERSCDEAVLEAGNEPKTYVEGVLKVCKFYLRSPLDCAAGVSGSDLNKRMEKIMENRLAIRLSKMKRAVLGTSAIIAVALPLAAGLLTSTLSLGNSTAQAAINSCGVKNLRPLAESFKKLPPYPEASQKAKEEGTALLQVVVGKDGMPTTLAVLQSSGFSRLDKSSIQWIKGNWRWAPLAQGCRSITTQTKVVWSLKDVPAGSPNLIQRK